MSENYENIFFDLKKLKQIMIFKKLIKNCFEYFMSEEKNVF